MKTGIIPKRKIYGAAITERIEATVSENAVALIPPVELVCAPATYPAIIPMGILPSEKYPAIL